MKVLAFTALCNGSIVLWMLWLSWHAYRGCDTFSLVVYLVMAGLNLGVLSIQWTTFQMKRSNDKRLAEQQVAFDAMLDDLAKDIQCMREAE